MNLRSIAIPISFGRWSGLFLFGLLFLSSEAASQRTSMNSRDPTGARAGSSTDRLPPDPRQRMSLPKPGAVASQQGSSSSASRVVLSLSLVLGAFFVLAWFARQRLPAEASLPAEAVEVLGRLALGPRESARLIRLGSKLALVADSPQGLTTLLEIDQPEEVDRLTELCQSIGRGREPQTWRGGDG